MGGARHLASRAALLLLLVAVQASVAWSQPCSSELTALNACAPFVVPGSSNTSPNSACCTALRTVEGDCVCNTMRIASQLPTQCNLPPLSCHD